MYNKLLDGIFPIHDINTLENYYRRKKNALETFTCGYVWAIKKNYHCPLCVLKQILMNENFVIFKRVYFS